MDQARSRSEVPGLTPQAYPNGRGTRANPLQDSDIQNEVTRAITQNGWSVDNNSVYFVITGVFRNTGALVEMCHNGTNCTFTMMCAFHNHFNSSGNNIRYGYLSDASFNTGGCNEGILAGVNGQVSSDREVALMTHELFEAITDPELNAWWSDSDSKEIGDKCSQSPAIAVMTNGNLYNVQQQWSNASASCVSSFGPSLKLTVVTGSDDLRGNSSADANLIDSAGNTFETFAMKGQNDFWWSGWVANTSHIAVGPFNQASSTMLARVAVTLTSHNAIFQSNDNWNIDALLIEVLDYSGNTLCTQTLSGNPLAQLTGSVPTVSFDTPNCQPSLPQEGVLCHVFNDGYTDMSDAFDAIFVNSNHQACIPGAPSPTCRKWAGRCTASSTGRTITMSVFDDGGANIFGSTDAIFINGQNQACVPDGTASGTCRKWFGVGQTDDGHSVTLLSLRRWLHQPIAVEWCCIH